MVNFIHEDFNEQSIVSELNIKITELEHQLAAKEAELAAEKTASEAMDTAHAEQLKKMRAEVKKIHDDKLKVIKETYDIQLGNLAKEIQAYKDALKGVDAKFKRRDEKIDNLKHREAKK